MTTSLTEFPYRPADPAGMHREICEINEQIAISGDLPSNRKAALDQLALWESEGITDVIDVRAERDDTDFIHLNSDIQSHWFGVDDCGGRRDPAWFERLTSVARTILRDPNRRLLVHCHMGVNRGPSAAFVILLDQGWDHLDALRAIRAARPIAGVIYAPDAVEWFTEKVTGCDESAARAREDVEAWLDRHPLDFAWVIGSIGRRTAV